MLNRIIQISEAELAVTVIMHYLLVVVLQKGHKTEAYLSSLVLFRLYAHSLPLSQ